MQDAAPEGGTAMEVDEALDTEMGEEPLPMLDALCVRPIFVDQLTSPSVFDCERLVADSIRFDPDTHNGFEEVDLCGTKVRVWRPSGAVSDTTLVELDPEGTFKGMIKEVKEV